MDDLELRRAFEPLYADINPQHQFFTKQPLLAHYTTVSTIEMIIKSKQMWFSNPLYMNDMEEVRFGLIEGEKAVFGSQALSNALRTPHRRDIFLHAFNYYGGDYVNNHLNDTYVLCFSEHERSDKDGRLSMWRGYGGNGRGAAIVIDTAKFNALPGSPLILAAVGYETSEGRRDWLVKKVSEFSRMLEALNPTDQQLHVPALALLERIRLAAVFSKHKGFDEEEEWRVVYMRERDVQRVFDPMLSYATGPHGIEQKLKFSIGYHFGATAKDLSIGNVVDSIILGPSLNSPMAKTAFERMLKENGEPDLASRVFASTIPYRPKG